MSTEGLSSGVALIASERARHVSVEGWTPEHDDEHTEEQLARAAACYASPPRVRGWDSRPPYAWPWDTRYWKPSTDRVRELVKAGALIAAEIDRLRRLEVIDSVSGAPPVAADSDLGQSSVLP